MDAINTNQKENSKIKRKRKLISELKQKMSKMVL